MKKLVLTFEVAFAIVPFVPLLSDAVFKTNLRTSLMGATMQWPIWIKIPLLLICILLYLYFWYTLMKESKKLAYEDSKRPH